jgi:hypothetical protein
MPVSDTEGIGYIHFLDPVPESARKGACMAVTHCAEDEGVSLADIRVVVGTDVTKVQAELGLLVDLARLHDARVVVTFGGATQDLLDAARTAELRIISVPDPSRRPGEQPPEAEPWTGLMEFDLAHGRLWPVGTVEVRIQPTIVDLEILGQPVAQMDRSRFRQWLHHPDSADRLVAGDVVWSFCAGVTCLGFGDSIPFIVPRITIEFLTAVI